MPQYTRNPPLLESELAADPLAQFDRWFADAQSGGFYDPTAMALATVGADGTPSARIVLFKGLHEGGLTFFTNYESRKGNELANNPRVAAVFWWDRLERQIRIEGRVEKLPETVSRQYFYQRPRESQLGACASQQSQPIASREALDARYDAVVTAYADQPVPYPAHWGGYRIEPSRFEFWQGRSGRLHDRLCYHRSGSSWRIERLQP